MYLQPEFAATLSESERTFSFLFHLDGELYRAALGRRTLKFAHHGMHYFIKAHTGVGWREIFKNLFQLRLPVISAIPEWNAIQRLRTIGIDTVTPVGYGCIGRNPARRQSFLITEDLGKTVTLEDLGTRWNQQHALTRSDVAFKRMLLQRVGAITRAMHDSGVNHRDLYLCHFHIPAASFDTINPTVPPRIYLMDLHRAQIRHRTPPRRWIIKDLAGLLFSSMDYGLTKRDRFRLITAYTRLPLRDALVSRCALWRSVDRRAQKLYERHSRRSTLATP